MVPVLDSSRAVPPDKGKKDSKRDWLQKQISGKKVSLGLLKIDIFDFNNASYSKMASNFVILLSL